MKGSVPASRTERRITPGERLQEILPGSRRGLEIGSCLVGFENAARLLEPRVVARSQQPVVTDFQEGVGQEVLQETADYRDRGGGRVPAVLGVEGDGLVVDGHEPRVGDRDAVRVAAEVFVDMLGSVERGFGVDDPLGAGDAIEELGESSVGQAEGLALMCATERCHEFALEEPAEDANGKEKAPVEVNPSVALRREATGRDHAVQVGMKLQIPRPRVQHSGEAE